MANSKILAAHIYYSVPRFSQFFQKLFARELVDERESVLIGDY